MFDQKWCAPETVAKGLLLAVPALLLFYALTQPRISYGDGHPYDSQSYFHMAQQVADGQPVAELRPFASRVALPWLVGTLFPDNLMTGFTVLNLAFAVAGLLLLRLYLKEFLHNEALVLVLLLLFVTNPNSPFRFAHFLPAYTDPPALFFMTLLLLLNRRTSNLNPGMALLLAVTGFAGVLFRELVISAVLVVSFCQCARLQGSFPFIRLHSMKALGLAGVPILAALAGISMANSVVESTGDYQYHVQALGVVKQLLQQESIYPLAWFTAFGMIPAIVLLGLNRQLLRFLAANQDVTLFLGGMAVLAAVAGFHTDRLVFWAYPAVLVVFGKVLASLSWSDSGGLLKVLFFVPLIVAQGLAFRVFFPIPDDVYGALQDPGAAPSLLLAVYGDGANLGQLYASTMFPADRLLLLAQFMVMTLYFGIVLFTGKAVQKGAEST